MRTGTEQSYQERLLVVLGHLEEHLEEPTSLEELARVAGFSPFHFHRIFRGMVGESVMEHIRRLRLERAARRLRASDQSVTEIALDAGYQAPEAFTRAFQAQFGLPPSAYRDSARCSSASTSITPDDASLRNLGTPRGKEAEMDVEVRTLDPIPVAYTRHIGPFHTVGSAWGRLCGWAGPRGLMGPHTRFLGVWLDDPEVTAPEHLRGDVCITVNRPVTPEGAVGYREIPGGEYAVVLYQGPYDGLGKMYAWLCGEWAPAAGYELRDLPGFEAYLNNPQTARSEDLLTEIYLPVERSGRRTGGTR